jgi:chromosome partitioning protein
MTEIGAHPASVDALTTAIVAIANQKGGVGKTTVAMQVGAELSRRHRVLVVDVDRQQSTVWWAENARDGLPFDFAGSQHPNVLSRLRELRAEYEMVLVDTPGSLEDTAVLETVLDAADYALVPVTPEPLAVDPTLRTLSRLIEPRRLRHGVLLNRIDPRVPHQLETWQGLLDSELGVPRLASYLRQYKVQSDAPVMGRLVTNMRRNRRTEGAIADIAAIARELEQLLSPALTGAW